MPEDEKEADNNNWFEPKMIVITKFIEETEKWMEWETLSLRQTTQENRADEEVGPDDGISQVGVNPNQSVINAGRSIAMSSRSSVCALEKAKLSGLVERAAVLQKNWRKHVSKLKKRI